MVRTGFVEAKLNTDLSSRFTFERVVVNCKADYQGLGLVDRS